MLNFAEFLAQGFENLGRLFERGVLFPQVRRFVVDLFVTFLGNLIADRVDYILNLDGNSSAFRLLAAGAGDRQEQTDRRRFYTSIQGVGSFG